MQISNRGISLIKEFEGLETEAYQDIVGVWTIGFGHTSAAGPPDVVPGMEITEAEATDILRRDLGQYERGVERAVKVDITQNMFDALVSLTYNIGVNGMKSSTFIKRLNQKNYTGAAEAMLWWNKAGGRVVAGLQRRREAEAALFLEGFDGDVEAGDDQRGLDVEENSPRRGSLMESRTVGGATAAGGAGAVTAGSVLLRDDEEEASEDTDTPGDDTPDIETPEAPEPSTEEPSGNALENTIQSEEARDAIVIAMGVIAVIAAIYIIFVRIDDWRNHKR